MIDTGVKFEITGDTARGVVRGYHGSPEPEFINKAKKVDLRGIKTTNIVETYEGTQWDDPNEIQSKFNIGFEIEKLRFHRRAVMEYPLFKGFETDSSCGVEAVTHVLPLLPKSLWRTKVFNMFVEAKKIISDEFSPSDRSCGGHITLSVHGLSGQEVAEKIRKNFGIFYAIFRKRLPNNYCSRNLSIIPLEYESSLNSFLGGRHNKYCPVKIMDHAIELRLPSRVQSVKQMMRRYELCYHLLDFSINNPNGTHKKFLKIIRPVLMSMYEGNAEKVDWLETLAGHFRRMILTHKFNRYVIPYVEGWKWIKSQYASRGAFVRGRELFHHAHLTWFDTDLKRNYDVLADEWEDRVRGSEVNVYMP
jgi:hypothetical protein